ncbi:hypothetical protein CRUP_027574 [Coryphaenoides rupestris]|nr:hypothetical protein CRUP_027574 [Coryphaenoides rupestris]
MDGLDSRGEIVVVGATNRLDSIDPALRRPGRFDREFLFSLPDKKARKHILEIHTRDWNPKLAELFVDELAEKCTEEELPVKAAGPSESGVDGVQPVCRADHHYLPAAVQPVHQGQQGGHDGAGREEEEEEGK